MINLSFILFPVIGLFLPPDQKPSYPNSSSSFVEAFQNISSEPLSIELNNWNSRNIDFYTSDLKKFYNGQGIFQKAASIETSKLDKSGWSDSDWCSYQNINLAVDEQEQLYMAAFTRDEEGFNRADLFLLQLSTPPIQDLTVFNTEEKGFSTVDIDLQKISSKTFDCMDKTDFRAGSGLHLMRNGAWAIVSCPNGLEKTTTIHLFSEKKQ